MWDGRVSCLSLIPLVELSCSLQSSTAWKIQYGGWTFYDVSAPSKKSRLQSRLMKFIHGFQFYLCPAATLRQNYWDLTRWWRQRRGHNMYILTECFLIQVYKPLILLSVVWYCFYRRAYFWPCYNFSACLYTLLGSDLDANPIPIWRKEFEI